MVKFQIMSDLHIETSDNEDVDPLKYITPSANILILAGDIGRIHKYNQLKNFLTKLCTHFEFVLYVLGNQEFYHVKGIERKNMEDLLKDIEVIAEKIPNLHILNRSSVVIDNVCVAGCTLWSQPTVEVPPFLVRIHGMTTSIYNGLHLQDLSYVRKITDYCTEKKLKLLLVTHHSPTFRVTQNKSRDKYKSLYATNLESLFDVNKIHTWICGHVHANFDFISKGGTRLVCNQKGKPADRIMDFSLQKVINLI